MRNVGFGSTGLRARLRSTAGASGAHVSPSLRLGSTRNLTRVRPTEGSRALGKPLGRRGAHWHRVLCLRSDADARVNYARCRPCFSAARSRSPSLRKSFGWRAQWSLTLRIGTARCRLPTLHARRQSLLRNEIQRSTRGNIFVFRNIKTRAHTRLHKGQPASEACRKSCGKMMSCTCPCPLRYMGKMSHASWAKQQ